MQKYCDALITLERIADCAYKFSREEQTMKSLDGDAPGEYVKDKKMATRLEAELRDYVSYLYKKLVSSGRLLEFFNEGVGEKGKVTKGELQSFHQQDFGASVYGLKAKLRNYHIGSSEEDREARLRAGTIVASIAALTQADWLNMPELRQP
jgi:hypothetical protein